jgi:hypothetical protein
MQTHCFLRAFAAEEQLTKLKRHRSSTVGADFAAAASAVVLVHSAGSVLDGSAATATAAGQRPGTPGTQTAADAGAVNAGDSANRVRRYSKQRNALVAEVAAATGGAAVDDICDPSGAHRYYTYGFCCSVPSAPRSHGHVFA